MAVAGVALLAAVWWAQGSNSPAAGSRAQSTGSALSPAATVVNSGTFAAGACISYPPTSGNRHKTVFLDAGHGGIDPGAQGTTQAGATIYEANETLPVELDAMALLRAQGFAVVVSRTGSSTVVKLNSNEEDGGILTLQGAHDDVAARDICANDARAALLVGIYFDAGSSAYNAGSLTAYDTARPFSAQNLQFATLLQHDVVTSMNNQGWGVPDDGVSTDSSLGSCVACGSSSGLGAEAAAYDHLLLLGPPESGYFNTPSTMPGAVIEPLFITDPFEGTIASEAVGQQAIAAGIAQAVEQYFAPTPPTTTTTAS